MSFKRPEYYLAFDWYTLQRRKVKDVIQYVDYFHALDSLKLAEEIQKEVTELLSVSYK